MKNKCLIVMIVVILAAMGSVRTALADAAPPEVPPGASVGSGEPSTYVQMVSESVLMEITGYDGPPVTDRVVDVVSNMMIGHVQASFNMVNQGAEAETLDVRFPLGAPDGYGGDKTVENFTASVDGQVSETRIIEQKGEWGGSVPWATWKATFAPGQTVILSVDYDVHPEGYAPWGAFTYILETGAGWYGSIGEGTVTFRLPYEVNDLNTVKGNAWNWGEQFVLPSYTFSSTDIVWHFTNLEPTRESNIHFTVLLPAVWIRIERAQAAAQASPDSAEAQLELGNALFGALWFKYGLYEIGNSAILAEQARAAYKRAYELAPDNIDVCAGYLELLLGLWQPSVPSTKSEDLPAVMEHAKALAPNDPRVLELQQSYQYYQQDEIYFQHLPETMAAMTAIGPTNIPNADEARALTAIAGTDLAPGPVLLPTLTPAPEAVLTLAPTPVPVVASTSSSNTNQKAGVWIVIGIAMIAGAVAIGGVMVIGGAWAYLRKKPARR